MAFIKGESYEGSKIVEELEAEKGEPYFALHRDGHVLAFALNRWQNPDAPTEVLVGPGEGREKYADSFIAEKPVVPVFIKEGKKDKHWHCAGHFRLRDTIDKNSEKNKRVKPFDIPAIYKILFLEEVK